MVDTLRAMGIELMLSPYFHSISTGSKHYALALKNGFLVLDASGEVPSAWEGSKLYDLFQEEARAFAWKNVQEGYVDSYGLHYWWLDCDEPCEVEKNSALVYRNGTWPAAFVGAAYPHMLNQMVWEGQGAPGKEFENDVVMLARSAWAGSQRFGSAVWSGDTESNFQNLQEQFTAGLNLVMSGIPYWTTDIGGYNGGNINDPVFRQLIVRWFQWGGTYENEHEQREWVGLISHAPPPPLAPPFTLPLQHSVRCSDCTDVGLVRQQTPRRMRAVQQMQRMKCGTLVTKRKLRLLMSCACVSRCDRTLWSSTKRRPSLGLP